MNVSHLFSRVFFFLVHLQARRPQKQLKAHSAHPQNVHGTQVASASSRRHQLCSACPTFRAHPNLPFPICSLLSAAGSESEATPEKRPRTDEKEGGGEEARGTPKQKNRRRCYRCQTKLELVQQELGSCRCGQYQHTGHVTR